ncbi:E3 ubiquitin-protein ligase trul-1-like isoform X1 [Drosophila albomicans]|uniref:E3 ubiquitin-protein ligase trul-1-like isoform X1 n=2 Tax=Drosophila albomicans TaxID=7291 RepID=A0A6P8XV44_DROAB|nr:E3 ubiquitin-protein ligase trul-1-like isoform X1 [Drosophila albomicans]
MCGSWNSTMDSTSGNNSRRTSTSTNSDIDNHSKDYSSSKVNCTICLESYRSVDNIWGGTCGHVFHWKCLERWKENSEQCPTCRSTSATFFPIYLNFDESESNHLPNKSTQIEYKYEYEHAL